MKLVAKPPSVVLKEMFTSDVVVTESFIKNVAQKVLLPCNEVQIWLEHLKVIIENRKRGAAKAAATPRAKKAALSAPSPATPSAPSPATGPSSATWFCGKCGRDYEETDETELWIACNKCDMWYNCV